jgi:hypothetical protein
MDAPAAILSLLLPVLVWSVICLSGHVLELDGAFLFLVLALLVGVATVDRIATHTVHWMTANPLLDVATARWWRADWRNRFAAPTPVKPVTDDEDDVELQSRVVRAMRARAAYAAGVLWVLGAVVVPNSAIVLTHPPGSQATLGLQLVVGTGFGLVMVAICRSGGSPRLLGCYGRAVAHYFHYGKRMTLTPWMFQSPCGGLFARRLAPLASVALLSVAWFFLAAHSYRHLVFPPEPPTSHYTATAGLSWDGTLWPVDFNVVAHLRVAAAVLLMLSCAALAAPATLWLLGFIVIGPLVDAYHQTLET